MKEKTTQRTSVIVMIYSFILSVIVSQVLQLLIWVEDISFLAYFYVYVFCFSPLLICFLLSFLYKEMRTWKIPILLFATFNIVLYTMVFISYFSVDKSGLSAFQHFLNMYKYVVIYILENDNFNLVVLSLYIYQLIIFEVLLWATKNEKRRERVYVTN